MRTSTRYCVKKDECKNASGLINMKFRLLVSHNLFDQTGSSNTYKYNWSHKFP